MAFSEHGEGSVQPVHSSNTQSDTEDEYLSSDEEYASTNYDSDSMDSDSESEECDSQSAQKRLNSDKVARAAISMNLNMAQVSGVASLLIHEFGIPLFKDARTIMGTPTDKLKDDSFFHLGLGECILQKLRNGINPDLRELTIQLHINSAE